MKKTLKILVAIIVIVTLLGGNVSVLAAASVDAIKIANVESKDNQNDETSSTPDSTTQSDSSENEQDTSDEDDNQSSSDEGKPEDTGTTLENDGEDELENTASPINSYNLITSEGQPEGEPLIKTSTGKGKIWVEVNLRLPQINPNFTIKIKKGDVVVDTITEAKNSIKEELAGKESDESSKSFYTGLYYISKELDATTDDEKYSMEITGSNYLTYIQNNIPVKSNNETKIKLTNGYDANSLTKNEIGVTFVGDVNSDGEVNDTDVNKIISLIESGKYEAKCDLNGDKKVNIVDLSYVAINRNKEDQPKGATTHKLITDNVSSEATKGSVVGEAKIEDILEDNGKTVELAPADQSKPISEDNAIEISLDLGESNKTETEVITIAPSTNRENNITKGIITVEDEEGNTYEANIDTKEVKIVKKAQEIAKINAYSVKVSSRASRTIELAANENTNGTITIDPDGTIVLDLGKKIAIKKVTIKVTGTEGSTKLADISKVEFLNDMQDKIPAPSMDKPEGLTGEATSDELIVSWKSASNVTGYEVSVTSRGITEHHSVSGHSIIIKNFNGKEIKDQLNEEFVIRVQSVNGEWRSGYSDTILTLIPTLSSRPDAPDNLSLVGKFKLIEASWKDMKNKGTDTYNVYYKKDGDIEFTQVAKGLTTNSYKIENLPEDAIRYQVYVTGVNGYGESAPSIVNTVETLSVQPAELPKYKLLNTPNGEGVLTSHIKSATYLSGKMEGSKLDSGKSALGIVDNSYSSFWRKDDWDDGVSYGPVLEKGITVEFDKAYDMNYFTMAQVQNLDAVRAANITYWDEQDKPHTVVASFVVTRKDKNGRDYTTIKLTDKIHASKIHINLSRIYGHTRDLTIAEMCFYQYDDLEEQIDNLYEGQLHVTLKDNVTSDTIDELQKRLDTPDEASGELHPEYTSLKAELDTARDILANKNNFKKQVEIDTTVTSAKDGYVSFKGGINAWQPLGLVGYEGEELTIYVGNRAKNVGDSSQLRLIATQYDAEAAAWYKVVVNNLKIGKNTVTIPQIATFACETGGSLYIEYTGNNPSDEYAVRVIGGEEIPVLDLTKPETKSEEGRQNAIKEYIQKLQDTVSNLADKHKIICKNKKDSKGKLLKSADYDYNEETCILGATEIVIEDMMYSVSAKQILEGLGNGTEDDKVEKLDKSLTAMEDMIELFYSHKGMSREIPEGQPNSFPSGRQNIRYHRMFVGAAMYAGGLHIGIPWGDVQTLSKGNPIEETNGKYESGNYFGWGISHEIGHIINDSHYVHGEVTNNYFSVLSQAEETNKSVRFQYPEVYKKVTSGKVGKSDNVFTQLGLYWQLHLSFDKGYNFKQYKTQKEQLDNLVFARIDTYARAADSKTGVVDEKVAPKPTTDNGVKLTVNSDTDNNLMRLACAATKSNILSFFERWGMVPNEETLSYASQWPEDNKAYYYMTDEARAYQLENKAHMTEGTKVTASLDYQVNVEGKETNNEVKITLGTTGNTDNNSILGYEIERSYMDNDKEIKRAVAFVSADDIYASENASDEEKQAAYKKYNIEYNDGKVIYTDRIDTINNRVITYTVTAYDKYLDKTKSETLTPIKIRNDGSISKEGWEITSNLVEEGKNKENYQYSDSYCEPEKETEISKIANNNTEDEYVAKLPTGENGEIIISLRQAETLTGVKYKAGNNNAIKDYEIQVSNDKVNWEKVKEGTFNTNNDNKEEKVYFNKDGDDKYYTYNTSYVKLVIKDQTDISIAEIDLLGESGDNIELLENGVGILKEDYIAQASDDKHEEVKIQKDSIVFTGTYKGNPAYNVVKLWDQDNKIISGSQIIFAENPEDGELGNVTDGIWVYYIEPDDENYQTVKESLKSIRAELYRVDNAETNEGERLVSDTFRVTLQNNWTNTQIELKPNKE